MAKKTESKAKEKDEVKDEVIELVPVPLPNGCISHWVPKSK